MQKNRVTLFFTGGVRSRMLGKFVGNLGIPHSVIVLVKGMAIYSKRGLAGLAVISHKFTFNCGF